MRPITQKFLAMSQAKKKVVHLLLAKIALEQWETFVVSGTVQLSYQESVIGTTQIVDKSLPSDALSCVTKRKNTANISTRYIEPISALQDDDWPLPERAKYAYYAIYNTFRKYVEAESIDDWLIVNQSLSSLEGEFEYINSILEKVLDEVA